MVKMSHTSAFIFYAVRQTMAQTVHLQKHAPKKLDAGFPIKKFYQHVTGQMRAI
jgi:hypothetical protein